MPKHEAWQTALLAIALLLPLVLGAVLYYLTSDTYKIRREQKRLGFDVERFGSSFLWLCTCCIAPCKRRRWEKDNAIFRTDEYGDPRERWLGRNNKLIDSNWHKLPRGDGNKRIVKRALAQIEKKLMEEVFLQAIKEALEAFTQDAQIRNHHQKIQKIHTLAHNVKIPSKMDHSLSALRDDSDESDCSEDEFFGVGSNMPFMNVVREKNEPKAKATKQDEFFGAQTSNTPFMNVVQDKSCDKPRYKRRESAVPGAELPNKHTTMLQHLESDGVMDLIVDQLVEAAAKTTHDKQMRESTGGQSAASTVWDDARDMVSPMKSNFHRHEDTRESQASKATLWEQDNPLFTKPQKTDWKGASEWGHNVVNMPSVKHGHVLDPQHHDTRVGEMDRSNQKRHDSVLNTSVVSATGSLASKPMSIKALINVTRKMKSSSDQSNSLVAEEAKADIALEFSRIPLNMPDRSALRPELEVYTNNLHRFPFAKNRVKVGALSGRSKVEQYINASFIRGPDRNEKKKFILTQLPMVKGKKASTVDRFWLMVAEQQSNIVVVVQHMLEAFWPTLSNEIQSGIFTISLRERNRFTGFDEIRVLMTNEAEFEFEVRIYLFQRWTQSLTEGPDVTCLFNLVREIDHHVRYSYFSTGPIVVMDIDGGDKAGAFIAVYHLMQKIKNGESVDVVAMLRHIREDRGGLISGVSEYILLHVIATQFALTINAMALTSPPSPPPTKRRPIPTTAKPGYAPPPSFSSPPHDDSDDC